MDDKQYGEIKVVTLPPMRVAAYRTVSRTPETDANAEISRWFGLQVIPAGFHARKFGFDIPVEGDIYEKDGLRAYEFWMTVPESVPASEDVTIKQFAGGLYAVMRVYDPFSDPFKLIPAGWQRLEEWVKANQEYQPGAHQFLEEDVEVANRDLDLYYPIVPKRA